MALLVVGGQPHRATEFAGDIRHAVDDLFTNTGLVAGRHLLARPVDDQFAGSVATNRCLDARRYGYFVFHGQPFFRRAQLFVLWCAPEQLDRATDQPNGRE
ncbi:hypothetical protein KIV56_13050 [Cryobacterium breve]|uniref:Uncharacterized protein n=1 Tax=Cryobacterium breve TaxID=1259258 RepID=A0ABY7NBG1_9MICO|nr:hypothetical protein [Cryobacterium breve]WBM79332.1 hypothetical protein KIV56_13050 [Cryobacterium breve]